MVDSDGVQAKISGAPDGAVQETSMSDMETPAVLTPEPELHESAAHHLAELLHDPDAIRHLFESGEYPYKRKLRRQEYEKHKVELQIELLKVQDWVKATGSARVVALEKPTEKEQTQWFFQRYIHHLPAAGEMVLFDRSWYNRAGVERVMGFCTPNDYLEFMRQTPEIECMLSRSGIRLFKYWFSVTQEEQLRRFKSREKEPLKKWKLSPIDRESLDK